MPNKQINVVSPSCEESATGSVPLATRSFARLLAAQLTSGKDFASSACR